jgi:hypothetical protein
LRVHTQRREGNGRPTWKAYQTSLTPEQRARWRNGARIAIDHPKYRVEQALTAQQSEELAPDFA